MHHSQGSLGNDIRACIVAGSLSFYLYTFRDKPGLFDNMHEAANVCKTMSS
jgi:hypothetical protein